MKTRASLLSFLRCSRFVLEQQKERIAHALQRFRVGSQFRFSNQCARMREIADAVEGQLA